MIFAPLQLIGGFILAFGMVPQLTQIIRTKKVSDLNLISILTVWFGIFCMELYAVEMFVKDVDYAFFITNTISLLFQTFLAIIVFIYRKPSITQKTEQIGY
jgi:MtN3 and saliva related transmembrane protein